MKVKELMYAHTDKAEAVGEREAFEASVPLCEMLTGNSGSKPAPPRPRVSLTLVCRV